MRAVPLADHLAEWSARTGITVRTWALPREPLPAVAAGLVHGMLRDVLEEVERQGSARTVSVALTLTAGRLRLTVSDDGSGTSADAFEAVLRDRRATIVGLGGRLAVNGVRGEGTTISAAVPLT